jgi:hypothetical protein
MPTNFPTSVDVFVNPTPTDSLNAPAHSTQHANANDAIEAIETVLVNGVNAWTSFTPTWSGLTVGNGVYNVSKYSLLGKIANVSITFTLGSTSAITGAVNLIVPANLERKDVAALPNAALQLNDTGTAGYVGTLRNDASSATTFSVRYMDTNNVGQTLSATIPFTWVTGDIIRIAMTYEAV